MQGIHISHRVDASVQVEESDIRSNAATGQQSAATTAQTAQPDSTASILNSGRRVQASAPTSRRQVQRRAYQLLLSEYLAMTAQNSTRAAHAADFEQPKGAAASVIKFLCPGVLDMREVCSSAGRAFLPLARLITMGSFVVIPLWLWLVRYEYSTQHHAGDAVLVALSGILLLVLSEFALSSHARAQEEARQGLVVASPATAYQKVPPIGSVYSRASTAPAVSSLAPALAGTSSHAGTATGSTSSRALPAVADPEAYHAVKQSIIRIEYLLFGNELAEGDIARDQLHTRTANLCREVGIESPADASALSALSLQQLHSLLGQVEGAVGVTPQ